MPRRGRPSEKRAAETGALIVPAYEDEVVFAGAGSVALEFAEQASSTPCWWRWAAAG